MARRGVKAHGVPVPGWAVPAELAALSLGAGSGGLAGRALACGMRCRVEPAAVSVLPMDSEVQKG